MRIERAINQEKGFTLIELTITMVLTGILFGVVAVFITQPMKAYASNYTRSEMVDEADLALRRIARDIQNALPNTIRVSGTSVETVNVVEAVRYKAQGTNAISFAATNTTFDLASLYQTLSAGVFPANYRLVIFNTGAVDAGGNPIAGINVYNNTATSGTTVPPAGTIVISPVGSITYATTSPMISLGAAWQPAFPSPQQRLYTIDGAVSYVCVPAAGGGTITRYSGYSFQNATQPTNPAVAPLNAATSNAQLLGDVTACAFTYQAGSTQHNALVTLQVTMTRSGETIKLLREVVVSNVP